MNVMALQSFGRTGQRPIDLLVAYRQALIAGSIRLRIYDTIHDRANRQGLIPEQAMVVLEEIKDRMKDIKETPFQTQIRLDNDFKGLTMGGRPHAEFRSLFEQKIDEMEEFECLVSPAALCRAYLTKITPDLRQAVMYREWPLDPGDGDKASMHRAPVTWQEVARCCVLVLEKRMDIKAPHDSLCMINDQDNLPGPGRRKKEKVNATSEVVPAPKAKTIGKVTNCQFCGGPGHLSHMCPSKFTQDSGDSVNLIAAAKKSGKGCTTCGGLDHRAHHHQEAAERAVINKLQKKGGADGVNFVQPYQNRGGNDGGRGGDGGKGKGKQKGNGAGPPGSGGPGAGAPMVCFAPGCGLTAAQHKDGRFCSVCHVCGKSKDKHDGGKYCTKDSVKATKGGEKGRKGKQPKPGPKANPKPNPKAKGKNGGGTKRFPPRDSEGAFVIAEGDKIRHVFDIDPSEINMKALTFQQLCLMNAPTPARSNKAGHDKVHSLTDLFMKASKNGGPCKTMSLDSMDRGEFSVRTHPRPSGYVAQTLVHMGGLCIPTMLDSCATCSIIPEEVLLVLLDHVSSLQDSGELSCDSPNFPIVCLERYLEASSVVGVGGDKMEASYGVVLRAEFVRSVSFRETL